MENEVSKILERLRKLYAQQKVSVLVGAGFSKNACEEYPSWNEMLYDMVVELYQEEIDTSFIRYRLIHPTSKEEKTVFMRKEVDRIIERVGHLNLVSEFIARKGYREAMEHYIEERIPYIDVKNAEFRFTGINENMRIPIIPEKLSVHKKLVNMRSWERVYTTNYDKLLEYAVEVSGAKLSSVITKANQLSFSSEKVSIVKLHGDLQDPNKNRNFRFDGNPHQQYIISAEDYKNYPHDHEAFTQLMRISLLQGVFCLVGFSGNDPNFMNWIDWVRDVIVRDDEVESENHKDNHKVFLVDVSASLPAKDKMIYYENHRIFYIPLLSKEVRNVIDVEPTNNDIRDILIHFFNYLEPEEPHRPQLEEDEGSHMSYENPNDNSTIVGLQQSDFKDGKEKYDDNSDNKKVKEIDDNTEKNNDDSDKKEYSGLWSKVFFVKVQGDFPKLSHSLTIDEDKVKQIGDIKVWNRFVNYSDRQRNYLEEIQRRDSISESEAQLAILALRDSGITVNEKLEKLISESGINNEQKEILHILKDRTETLECLGSYSGIKTISVYEQILRYFFSFNFEDAKKLLKIWGPTGVDVLKKAVFMAFFNENGVTGILSDFINQEPNVKEQFYAARLLNIIKGVFPVTYGLSKYSNTNVQDYLEVLSFYLNRVNTKKDKIGAYGDGLHNSVFYMDGKPSREAESLAVLNFMIEAPSLLSYRNFYILVSPEKWYPVHSNLFEKYPLPTLFYSIQCTDKKVRARIGQDYAYSDTLQKNCLEQILNNLLSAILSDDTPQYLIEAMLDISKEMFVSVPSSKWEHPFLQIWDKAQKSSWFDKDTNRFADVAISFVYKAFNSLFSNSVRSRIISDLLHLVKTDTVFVINCLYFLNVRVPDFGSEPELMSVLNRFIMNLDTLQEITVAGNLYGILSEEQKETVAEKCSDLLKINIGKNVDKSVYHSAKFFFNSNLRGQKVLVDSACANPKLWDNGIGTDGENILQPNLYLKLSDFIYDINVDRTSLLSLYSKMKESLQTLMTYYGSHNSTPAFYDTNGLLAEMLSFVDYYKRRLKEQEDYSVICSDIKELLRKISGLLNVKMGLLSENEDNVKQALDYIYSNRKVLSRRESLDYVSTIIDRVLMCNNDGMDTCISYLRLYLMKGLIRKDDSEAVSGLKNILDKYNKDIVQQCNMEVVMASRNLAKIAVKLQEWGCSSYGINYWIDIKESKRFMTTFD